MRTTAFTKPAQHAMFSLHDILCSAAGAYLLLVSVFLRDKPLPFVVVGFFLVIGGIVLLRTTEVITTTIAANGLISIQYKRIVGGRTWLRRFWCQNIESVNVLKSFKNVGSPWSMDKLFLKKQLLKRS